MPKTVAIACLAFFCAPTLAGDAGSVVKADFVGNGVLSTVTLVQSQRTVTVIVRPASAHATAKTLTFGVNASQQDAICGLPASIKIVPLSCSAAIGRPPGCVQNKDAKAVLLSGGECDPIYIYWDHAAGQLSWWRN